MISCDTPRPNFTVVTVGDVTLWFSYKTPVAYRVSGSPAVVRENDWGPTTGKHLNAIDGGDKEARIPGEQFTAQLREIAAGLAPAVA